jgi:SM-20-related protein
MPQTALSDQFNAVFEKVTEQLAQEGYCILKNALPPFLQTELLNVFQQLAPNDFSNAGVGRAGDYLQSSEIRSDKIVWIDGTSTAGEQWLAWCEALRVHLNRHLFLGLFSFESHFAHYAPGDFYKRHYDAFAGRSNRKLSLVCYLNAEWSDNDGGQLVIYHNDDDINGLRVLPEAGTLVIFLSEQFPHEVLPAHRDRVSIAGWFRVNGSGMTRVDPPR